MTKNSTIKWESKPIDDGDKIVCVICGKPHTLYQGTVHSVRIGDGILFYRCGSQKYIGAINKATAFGVNAYDSVRSEGLPGRLDTDVRGQEVSST